MNPEQKPPLESPEAEQPLEPVKPPPSKKLQFDASKWQRLRFWYGSHKKWTIPATVLVILLILAAVPWSRYKAAGLMVKKDFSIQILDSASQSPVSEATVKVGSRSAQTDGNGRAQLRLSAGRHTAVISKKYYQTQHASLLVPILSQKSTPAIKVDATGRQVKIVVKNLVSQKALADVDIKVADVRAKTDKNGEAIVVLPVGARQQKAVLSLKGYNDSEVSIQISDSGVAENFFSLTPAGKVYFLSNRTGKLDVMKANLDGSQPQVAVAGTGREGGQNTTLLTSPSQKYVALAARRSADYATPQLHILSAEDDKLLGVDQSNAEFQIVGWSGDNLIYTVSRSDLPDWQPGINKLKSYDATTGKITLLSQSSAVGDSQSWAYEYYEFIMVSADKVAYAKNWYTSDEAAEALLSDKQNSLLIINANGQDSKTLSTYDAKDFVSFIRYKPNAFYIRHTTPAGEKKFYEYVFGLAGPKSAAIDENEFNNSHQLFFVSPSGKKSAWAEARDGKYSILVGDSDGLNTKTVSSLAEFNVYDWYSEEYLLVTKGGSELYIMSAEGSEPVKITDFQPTVYSGY